MSNPLFDKPQGIQPPVGPPKLGGLPHQSSQPLKAPAPLLPPTFIEPPEVSKNLPKKGRHVAGPADSKPLYSQPQQGQQPYQLLAAGSQEDANGPLHSQQDKESPNASETRKRKKLIVIIASSVGALILLLAGLYIISGIMGFGGGSSADDSSSPVESSESSDSGAPEAITPVVPETSAEVDAVFQDSLTMMGVTMPLADAKVLAEEVCALMSNEPTRENLGLLVANSTTDPAVMTERSNVIGAGVSLYCPESYDLMVELVS